MSPLVPAVLLTTVLFVLASIAGCYADNLLSDPGFESGVPGQKVPGWNSYGRNSYIINDAGIAHGGTNCFKVYQAFTGAVNYNGIYQDYISGPGAVYSADGWAYASASDAIAGQNAAWVEVTFRDANANILALYQSARLTTNSIASGTFPANTWINLAVTNQCDPHSYQITNQTAQLTAPEGTYFVRYQIIFQGDAHNSGGSTYFDDLDLSRTDGRLTEIGTSSGAMNSTAIPSTRRHGLMTLAGTAGATGNWNITPATQPMLTSQAAICTLPP